MTRPPAPARHPQSKTTARLMNAACQQPGKCAEIQTIVSTDRQPTPDPPDAPLPTDKESLRHWMRSLRRVMPIGARNEASNRIMQRVLELPELTTARTVALYASFGSEVRTHELIRQLGLLGKRIVLPRVIHWKRELELHHVPDFPRGCIKGDFGILEPSPLEHVKIDDIMDIDLFLVPGLIFDGAGYRIGYGGGFYDRLLAHPHRAPAVGIAFQCQIVEQFERQDWDRPVQMIATEDALVRCGPDPAAEESQRGA